MSKETGLVWCSSAATHVGNVRALNEDAFIELTELGIWAVADGMGGHESGDMASRMVVDALANLNVPINLDGFVDDTRTRLNEVNTRLRDLAKRRGVGLIGCTVTTLLAFKDHCTCLWAGDSRTYRLRVGRLEQLTHDHTQVEELTRRGLITREQANAYPASNLITRAVGAADDLELDEVSFEAQGSDMFLLCSDGLYNELSEQDIINALLTDNCQLAAQGLLTLALQHGGRDNISVIVVRADAPDSVTRTLINPLYFPGSAPPR